MEMFHPVHSLDATSNCLLILLSKIWLVLSYDKHTRKKFQGFQNCAFFSSFSGCYVIGNFVFFSLNKSYKTYLEPKLPPGGRNWQLIHPNWPKHNVDI